MDDSKRGIEIQFILQIELQNRLLVPVAIPHLELTLSDADEKPLPANYLTFRYPCNFPRMLQVIAYV